MFGNFVEMAKKKVRGYDENFYMSTAAQFVRFMNATYLSTEIRDDAPESLLRLKEYFSVMKKSSTYKKLEEMAWKFTHDVEVSFRISCSQGLEPGKVVSASVVKPRKIDGNGEFSDHIEINSLHMREEHFDHFVELLHRIALGKYERQLGNASAQFEETYKLMPALAFYVGFTDIFTKLKGRGFDICRPTVQDHSYGRTSIKDARHPLIKKGPVVGNNIYFDPKDRNRVITGATYAGKTVYIETIGMNQVFGQVGLLVLGSEAEISLRDEILTHIVVKDDPRSGESGHSEEMKRMNQIYEAITPRSLVLLNEPCKGNYSEAAVEQTLSFLKAFELIGNPTYIATHLHDVAEAVDRGEFPHTRNFHFPFSGQPPNVTYSRKLTDGKSPVNYGHIIAALNNLSDKVLMERARRRARL